MICYPNQGTWNTSRISHDALYNMHEIALDTGSDFIHLLQTHFQLCSWSTKEKFQKHHEVMFQFIRDNIKFSKRSVALVTDGEQGMINAMHMLPSAVDIRCWNHVLQDLQRWLLENGANKAESAVYKDEIRQILCAKSEEDMLKTFDVHSRKWDPKVTKYVTDRIISQLQSLARWAIETVTNFDPYSVVQTLLTSARNVPLN